MLNGLELLDSLFKNCFGAVLLTSFLILILIMLKLLYNTYKNYDRE